MIRTKGEGDIQGCHPSKGWHPSNIIGRQFATFFKSYTQAINKKYDRTGSLFDKPFRRIAVEGENYFTTLIQYIHFNPENHGLIQDFKDYPHSSYHSHLSNKKSNLQRNEVLDWFGGKEEYISFHEQPLSNFNVDIE